MKLEMTIPVTLIIGYPCTYPDSSKRNFEITVNMELESLYQAYKHTKGSPSILNLVLTALHQEMAGGNPRVDTKDFFKELQIISKYPGEVYVDIISNWFSIVDTSENLQNASSELQEEVAISEIATRMDDFKIQNPAYNSNEDLRKLLVKYLQRF